MDVLEKDKIIDSKSGGHGKTRVFPLSFDRFDTELEAQNEPMMPSLYSPGYPSLFGEGNLSAEINLAFASNPTISSGEDLADILGLLQLEEKALIHHIETLRESIAQYKTDLASEIERIKQDIQELETHTAKLTFTPDSQFQNTTRAHLMGQIVMLRHNKRLYAERIAREIRDMEITLVHKEKELTSLQAEIKMIFTDQGIQ